MSATEFIRKTLLDPRSPGCFWIHPWQALKIVGGALANQLLALSDRLLPSKQRECPVCGWRGRAFRTFLSADEIIPESICPACGSFDRHRLLVLGVRQQLHENRHQAPGHLVGFSLSRAMQFLLEHEGLARCFRSEFAWRPVRPAPDFAGDLCRVPLNTGSVDWVFCSHVLEHIFDLTSGLDEVFRILRPGGLAWLQVPLEPGLAHSRRLEIDPYRAHAHAWQFAPDFHLLIERPGWDVTEVLALDRLSAPEARRFGIDLQERYWLARKDG